jgi:subtilisin family serine protease
VGTRTHKLAAVLVTAAGVLAVAASVATASPPPRLDRAMHWYRWHPSARTLQGRTGRIGSTAVLGLASMAELAPLRGRYGFRVVRAFPQLRAAEVRVSRLLVAGAARDRRIRYLSPLGGQRRLMATPNDPLLWAVDPWTHLPYEWQFGASHVDRALDLSSGSPTILVGTIDTGAADVPDLAGKIDQRWTVSRQGRLTRDSGAADFVGHGTAVASLIAANVDDGFGMAGFGGATHVIVIRAWAFTDVSTAAALMKLDSLGVRIVNMSFGGDAPEKPIMLDAIHKAAVDGMLLVAAVGNSAHAVAHPAADLQPADGVQSYGLAVGASDAHGSLAFFSNAGTNLSLIAPGGYEGPCTGVLVAVAPTATMFDPSCSSIWAGTGGALYTYAPGTSFSAPEVAGVAALIWSARPQLKNYQVADIIKQSAHRDAGGWTPTMGCGALDAGAALELTVSRSSDEWATADAHASSCSATC